MDGFIRPSLFEITRSGQQELAGDGKGSRLPIEASESATSKFSRLVRLPVGRAIVAVGRGIQGGSAAATTERFGPSTASRLAR